MHCHIDELWRLLEPHSDYLKRLKSKASVAIHLGYLTSVESAGVSIPHSSLSIFLALELDLELHITVVPEE